jgi:hypothetical protein
MTVKIVALSLTIVFAFASGSDTHASKKGPENVESVQAALDAGRARILEVWGSQQAVEPPWVPLQPQFWRDRSALRAGGDGYFCRFAVPTI